MPIGTTAEHIRQESPSPPSLPHHARHRSQASSVSSIRGSKLKDRIVRCHQAALRRLAREFSRLTEAMKQACADLNAWQSIVATLPDDAAADFEQVVRNCMRIVRQQTNEVEMMRAASRYIVEELEREGLGHLVLGLDEEME